MNVVFTLKRIPREFIQSVEMNYLKPLVCLFLVVSIVKSKSISDHEIESLIEDPTKVKSLSKAEIEALLSDLDYELPLDSVDSLLNDKEAIEQALSGGDDDDDGVGSGDGQSQTQNQNLNLVANVHAHDHHHHHHEVKKQILLLLNKGLFTHHKEGTKSFYMGFELLLCKCDFFVPSLLCVRGLCRNCSGNSHNRVD